LLGASTAITASACAQRGGVATFDLRTASELALPVSLLANEGEPAHFHAIGFSLSTCLHLQLLAIAIQLALRAIDSETSKTSFESCGYARNTGLEVARACAFARAAVTAGIVVHVAESRTTPRSANAVQGQGVVHKLLTAFKISAQATLTVPQLRGVTTSRHFAKTEGIPCSLKAGKSSRFALRRACTLPVNGAAVRNTWWAATHHITVCSRTAFKLVVEEGVGTHELSTAGPDTFVKFITAIGAARRQGLGRRVVSTLAFEGSLPDTLEVTLGSLPRMDHT
jgi:hypothetical protein